MIAAVLVSMIQWPAIFMPVPKGTTEESHAREESNSVALGLPIDFLSMCHDGRSEKLAVGLSSVD